MTPRTTHPVAPYLLLAELGAALFGGTAASAEERITLEVIGAVRMAADPDVRRADGAHQRAEIPPARETAADHADAWISSHHN